MADGIELGRELGFISCKSGTVQKPIQKNDTTDPKKQIILTTGSEGEAYSGLWRMAHGEHPTVQIQSGDGVLLSSSSLQ
jgi:ribonuclease J